MNERRKGADPYQDLSQRTSGQGRRNGLLIGGIALAVVVVLAVVAVVLAGNNNSRSSVEAVQEAGPIEVVGDPLPPFPRVPGFVAEPSADPAVGATPPTLIGENFQGSAVTLEPGKGTPMVVVFMAHWCPHCQREVPRLQKWVDDGNLPKGVQMWAVSTGARSDQNNYPPSKWLAREGWTGPILLDNADNDAANAWGLTGYPYLVFVDAQGKVVGRASGELPIDQFEALVKQIS